MYIEPNSNIIICKSVPLDNTYENTVYFDSPLSQESYFSSKQKYNLTNYSYQRVEKGKLRAEIKADNLYDCNYMMFKNSNFGNKWFYAFITSVEYVNNVTSEISFEIDVMQTYFFDTTLLESLVLREHSSTDVAGENIQPENVELGEYFFTNYKPLPFVGEAFQIGTPTVVIIYVADREASLVETTYDGVFSGLTLFAFDIGNESERIDINEFLRQYSGTPEEIVMMYMCPSGIVNYDQTSHKVLPESTGRSADISLHNNLVGMDFDGYTPKNKKLYTFPYAFYNIDNGNESIILRNEFFSSEHIPRVEVISSFVSPVELKLRPLDYKGSEINKGSMGSQALRCESLSISGFPVCAWSNDSFSRWAVQGGMKAIGDMVIDAATFNATGFFGEFVGGIKQGLSAMRLPDIPRGKLTVNADFSHNMMSFNESIGRITGEYCEVIDNYFSKYGYATNKLKIPNRNVRPSWTYCKTLGCNMVANAPTTAIAKMKSIYDNGITFWKSNKIVGDYSQENEV